ncbi:MAG TPA: hypothetical protein VKV26_07460 [Dehalococcoidia bacterium]|nr:hypothetical protein [Dehalococcoidia bacterium]
MTGEALIGDPIQAGCAAGRRARAEDGAAGLEPAGEALLLMRAALACTALVGALPGPPQHDPAIARERFVWGFVLGYGEGTGNEGIGGGRTGVRRRPRRLAQPPAVRRAGAAGRHTPGVRTRMRRTDLRVPSLSVTCHLSPVTSPLFPR